MPMYDYECKNCGKDFEMFAKIADRKKVKSPCCNSAGEQLITGTSYHPFPEGFWEHIANEPIYVNDKPHLKRLCEEHGCHATGMLD